tara:strand:+ start:1133 stop:1381 length:249 start_codon:yes stop_codon:yes gene_type:complete
MQITPLNTMPIQAFIQQVQTAENSRSNDVRLDINTAKNLAFTLGLVMARLEGELESLVSQNKGSANLQDIEVKIGSSNADWK